MRRALHWFLRLTALVLLLVALVLTVAWFWSAARMNHVYMVDTPAVLASTDPAAIERGRHLLLLAKCGQCHGEDLGGGTLMDAPLLGRVCGPNLTPAGVVRTDAELARALRHGVGPDGRGLVGMPTADHQYLSDAELADILSALRAAQPVERTLPPNRIGPIFRLLHVAAQIELIGAEGVDHERPANADVTPSTTEALGSHLVAIGGCLSCHGATLSGGTMAGAPPDFPPASNLTPDPASGLGSWTEAEFVRALRSRIRPDGSAIDPAMP